MFSEMEFESIGSAKSFITHLTLERRFGAHVLANNVSSQILVVFNSLLQS